MKQTALAISLVTLAIGCEKSSKELDPSEFPAGPDDPAIVEVESAGSGEKRVLRLEPEPGTVQNVAFAMKMDGSMIPSMDMTMDMRAQLTEVHDNGDFDLEMAITNASMSGMPGGAGDMLSGITFAQRMSARGETKSFELVGGAPGMESLFDQSLTNMQFAFPEEAVGKGASWEMRSVEERQGMRILQIVTMKIDSMDGDVVVLDMKIEQQAKDQTMDTGMATAHLDYLHTTGGGKLHFDLGKPMPTEAKMKLDMKMKVSVSGQSQEADMDLDLAISSK